MMNRDDDDDDDDDHDNDLMVTMTTTTMMMVVMMIVFVFLMPERRTDGISANTVCSIAVFVQMRREQSQRRDIII